MHSNTATEQDNTNSAAELREQAQVTLDSAGMSICALAKELGVPDRTLGRWLKGEDRPSDTKLEAALRDWMHLAFPSDLSTRDAFVETASAERILSTLAYAQANGDMVAIYGGPGVGKTRTVHHYRQQYRNVWVTTISPASAAVVPALEEVAEAVGLQDVSGGARRIARAIRRKVMRRLGIIVVDEAQHLSMSAIEELRSLHDATGVALALVGNEVSYARLTGPTRSAHFAQISSRLGMRLYLKRPAMPDVRLLAKASGVTSKEAIELLERVGARPGALRGVVKVLRLASVGGKAPTLALIQEAVSNLGAEL